MVDRQVRTFDVTESALLARMIELPREPFLPDACSPFAYSDSALQVSARQVAGSNDSRRVLAPMVLARMIQALRLQPADRALDVAGGGGYGAGLMAGLCLSVVAVESLSALTERAAKAFFALQISNARATTGGLIEAGGESGPFDAILVEGSLEEPPNRLLALLSEGGRLAAIFKPGGDPASSTCMATLWTRSAGAFGRTPLFNAPAHVLAAFAKPPVFAF
jgi:protein-L-isoaspartate(D-aspartate) O-methyltransferase